MNAGESRLKKPNQSIRVHPRSLAASFVLLFEFFFLVPHFYIATCYNFKPLRFGRRDFNLPAN